jgi:nitrite reductase/ring-hydroxylating ferredoxin subunit
VLYLVGGGQRLVLVRTERGVFAYEDRCARLKCVAAKIASGLVLVDVTNAAAEELES